MFTLELPLNGDYLNWTTLWCVSYSESNSFHLYCQHLTMFLTLCWVPDMLIVAFNLHSHFMRYKLELFTFYRWGSWGWERWGNLPRTTEPDGVGSVPPNPRLCFATLPSVLCDHIRICSSSAQQAISQSWGWHKAVLVDRLILYAFRGLPHLPSLPQRGSVALPFRFQIHTKWYLFPDSYYWR